MRNTQRKNESERVKGGYEEGRKGNTCRKGEVLCEGGTGETEGRLKKKRILKRKNKIAL